MKRIRVMNANGLFGSHIVPDDEVDAYIQDNLKGLDPTEYSIEVDELDNDFDWRLSQVRRSRAMEYPPIGDQLDALWKGGEVAEEMLNKIRAVKLKYPKPTGDQ